MIAGKRDNSEEEFSNYMAAMKIDPNNPLIYNKLALFYKQSGNYDKSNRIAL
jgi:lipoprotein NlpI